MNIRNAVARWARFFKPDATDENWSWYGEKCAYFGVVTWPQFRPENLTDTTRQEFFQTGEQYVERLFETIRGSVAPDFEPHNSVDFGCGVGRLVVPLARRGAAVVGIDVSVGMLAEAKRNCEQQGLEKVSFIASVDELKEQAGQFDFIHSFIVFQHIRPERGYEIFKKLVDLLREGGVGAIHFTYCDPGARRQRLKRWFYRKIPLLWVTRNIIRRRPAREPMMDMANYSLNKIFHILQEAHCDVCHTRFSDHGVLGVLAIFKKAPLPSF